MKFTDKSFCERKFFLRKKVFQHFHQISMIDSLFQLSNRLSSDRHPFFYDKFYFLKGKCIPFDSVAVVDKSDSEPFPQIFKLIFIKRSQAIKLSFEFGDFLFIGDRRQHLLEF